LTEAGSVPALLAPSESFVSASSFDARPTLPECAICLETSDPSIKVMLSCGHLFCRSCIFQYVEKQSLEQRKTNCPQCKRELQDFEVKTLLNLPDSQSDALLTAIQQRADSSAHDGSAAAAHRIAAAAARLEDCELLHMAHARDMKHCPSCSVLIQKNGGCDHMTCRCGHEFSWSAVPTPATGLACDCVHPHPRFGVWGMTCDNCTWSALSRLTARRTVIVAGAAIAVPVVIVGTVAVMFVGAAAAGAAAGLDKCKLAAVNTKSAVENTLPDHFEKRRAKAQLAVEAAESLVEEALHAVEHEEQKWFNSDAIEDARTSLASKRAMLARARETYEEKYGAMVETNTVTLPCCNLFHRA